MKFKICTNASLKNHNLRLGILRTSKWKFLSDPFVPIIYYRLYSKWTPIGSLTSLHHSKTINNGAISNKLKAQIQIKPTVSAKIRIDMANDKFASTNVQSSDLQDDMALVIGKETKARKKMSQHK